jgi:hypothetical protein
MAQPAATRGGVLTAFEAARIENIRRNNNIMESMGIPGLVPDELRLRAASGRCASASRRKKRRTVADKFADQDTAGRRRSARLANVPATVFTTFEEDEDLGDSREKRTKQASAVRAAEGECGEVRVSGAMHGVYPLPRASACVRSSARSRVSVLAAKALSAAVNCPPPRSRSRRRSSRRSWSRASSGQGAARACARRLHRCRRSGSASLCCQRTARAR